MFTKDASTMLIFIMFSQWSTTMGILLRLEDLHREEAGGV